jgi:hypothetical protein
MKIKIMELNSPPLPPLLRPASWKRLFAVK